MGWLHMYNAFYLPNATCFRSFCRLPSRWRHMGWLKLYNAFISFARAFPSSSSTGTYTSTACARTYSSSPCSRTYASTSSSSSNGKPSISCSSLKFGFATHHSRTRPRWFSRKINPILKFLSISPIMHPVHAISCTWGCSVNG
jgi:hypothetical protein